MKVLYFHQHFSTPDGSAGIRSYAMAKKLVESGHQVTMVCGSFGIASTGLDMPFTSGVRRGPVDGFEVIEFELPYSNNTSLLKRAHLFISFAIKSIRVAFTEEYDLLFATTTPLTSAVPGIVAKHLKSKPFVFEVRDLWPELPRAMGVITNPVILFLLSALEWSAYKSADKLIALSPGIKKGIIRYRKDEENIAMIPNGCDMDIFSSARGIPWRPDGVKESDFLAIFTGTHGLANGLDAVIDAAIILKKQSRDDIKLLLIGDGKLKPALQARVQGEQLDNVIFHPPVNKEKLAGLMQSADLGMQTLANVSAFYYGTSPNKFFDYLAAGLPILNNYPGWVADLIEENQCGIAIEPDNANAFANALIKLSDERDELPKLGNAAQSLAKKAFDRGLLSDQFVKQLESAL